MRTGTRRRRRAIVLCACMAWVTRAGMTRPAPASTQTAVEAMVVQSTPLQPPLLLRAARLVNGQQRHDNAAVVVSGRTIAALGAADQRRAPEAFVRDLGATTMLPQHAVQQDVTMVTPLAPLAPGPGIHQHTATLAALGATVLSGAESTHTERPWGMDAAALHRMGPRTGRAPLDLCRAAPAHTGVPLGLALLGTLTPSAPADLIAVRGDPCTHCKLLEYPDVVISRGRIVVNHGEHCGSRVVPRPRHTPVSRGCAHHPRPRTAL